MGVYIKGMEMPTSCGVCKLVNAFVLDGELVLVCPINGEAYSKIRKGCPLVFVPPHGRLIDGDAAECISFTEDDAGGKDFYDGILFAADFISKQPTIIPADGEEAGE